jgi:hypothetical protein
VELVHHEEEPSSIRESVAIVYPIKWAAKSLIGAGLTYRRGDHSACGHLKVVGDQTLGAVAEIFIRAPGARAARGEHRGSEGGGGGGGLALKAWLFSGVSARSREPSPQEP